MCRRRTASCRFIPTEHSPSGPRSSTCGNGRNGPVEGGVAGTRPDSLRVGAAGGGGRPRGADGKYVHLRGGVLRGGATGALPLDGKRRRGRPRLPDRTGGALGR